MAFYYFLTVFVYAFHSISASKVLLISMDGFRWDYINQVNTPSFDAFAENGMKAPFINNTFITKTFPCHYAIATGLYEESHGIVSNHMYDPVFNSTFNMGTKESKWWDAGEPLWVTVQKHGLRSAVFFWPGSEAKIRGLQPNIYKAYNESIPFEQRVDTVTEWLANDTYNIDLAMLYFHEPDHTGHEYGASSKEVRDKVSDMDTLLGYIIQKFTDNDLLNKVNILVTSDHGMTDVDINSRGIDLSKYIDLSAIVRAPTLGSIANIQPVEGKEDELFQNLTGIDKMSVYKKHDIPEHWHYKNNIRVLPILAVANEGWLIVTNVSGWQSLKGTHGYDNRISSMKPIFYARGPNIKKNYTAAPFNSVDIYPLVCELLGVFPSDNNGSLVNTRDFIVNTNSNTSGVGSHVINVLTLCLIFLRMIFSKCLE